VARQLAGQGVAGLVSFGLAGGLSAAAAPGALVIPGVIVPDPGYKPIPQPDARLTALLGGPTAHTLLASAMVAVSAEQKQRLHEETGADAVDTETATVAEVAREYDLPFAVLRAVSDDYATDLPEAALVALSASGAIVFPRVLASVLRHPGQIGALLRLGRQAALARRALIAHVDLLETNRSP
jgi:adenosylhomocysteine nucleosidase